NPYILVFLLSFLFFTLLYSPLLSFNSLVPLLIYSSRPLFSIFAYFKHKLMTIAVLSDGMLVLNLQHTFALKFVTMTSLHSF
ncbi:hypothetical protein, partial [Alteromonas stellipolaris]|uniref:hypothetical protein n=1 Tax=Alteromonas stellipolaris TaxID=233316 RepID=UPI0030F63497